MLGAGARRLMEPPVALDHPALAVYVLRPTPILERSVGAALVAPLRHDVEGPVDAEELLPAATVRRVGVEHSPGIVLEEDAVAREVRQTRVGVTIVVERAPARHLVRLERDVEVVVEVGVVRADPGEAPAHAPADRLDLPDGRPGHGGVADIVVVQVLQDALDVVDLEGAPDALSHLAWTHHEVLDEELGAPVEQVRERDLAVRRIEDVFLLHPDPRQVPAHLAELVPLPGMRLLAGEQRDACAEPLLSGDDGVRRFRHGLAIHRDSSFFAGVSADAARMSPFSAGLARNFHTTEVARPPADPAPAAIRARVVRQAGHIVSPPPTAVGKFRPSFLWRSRSGPFDKKDAGQPRRARRNCRVAGSTARPIARSYASAASAARSRFRRRCARTAQYGWYVAAAARSISSSIARPSASPCASATAAACATRAPSVGATRTRWS